jgi:hypothetical protein
MVFPQFAFISLPGGNQANDFAAHGVGDRIKPPFYHAESEPPFLGLIAALVLAVQSVRVKKDAGRVIKRDAMLGDIVRGFSLVPFEQHCVL